MIQNRHKISSKTYLAMADGLLKVVKGHFIAVHARMWNLDLTTRQDI